MVSVVDSSVANGSGPIRVENGQQALIAGESLVVDGVTFEVVASTEEGDVVRVTAP